MTKHRQPGDWVWVKSYAGFVKSNAPMRAQIQNDNGEPWCFKNCGDDECFEWSTLHTDKGDMLCHVNECDMYDTEAEAKAAEDKLAAQKEWEWPEN